MLSNSTHALTVFVATASPEGVAVRELIASWTRSGILRPSIWVTPSDVDQSLAGPPRVQALIIGEHSDTTVDLFQAIGREKLNLIRVTVAHLVVDAAATEPEVASIGQMVANAINATLPRRKDGDALESGTRLQRTNALIPVSGIVGITESLLIAGWDVNAVVSPEDRPDLDRANVYVRRPENFSGHAAAALAAMGGIIVGIPSGAIDDLQTDSTTSERDVVITRFTVRAVIGDDVFHDLAKLTLEPHSFGPDGPAGALRDVRLASRPADVADAGAFHILNTPEWASTPRPPSIRPSSRSRGFWRSLLRAIKFNLGMFGVVLGWFLSKLRTSAEQTATEMIVGEDSSISVTIGAAPAATIYVEAESRLEANEASLKHQIEIESQHVEHPKPSAWSTLRRITLGLADGGKLPHNYPEPIVMGTREVIPLLRSVPNPADRWTGKDGTDFGPTDVAAERAFEDSLKSKAAELAAEKKENATASETVKTELKVARELIVNETAAAKAIADRNRSANSSKKADNTAGKDSETKPPGENDNSDPVAKTASIAAEREEELAALDIQLKTLEFERERIDSVIRQHTSETGRFESWRTTQSSVMRSVIVGLVDRIEGLRSSHGDNDNALEGRPPRKQLERAQKALRVIWTIISLLFLGTSAVMWLAFFLPNDYELTDALRGWGIATGIAFVILVVANHSFYKAVQHYEWQVAQRLASQQNAADTAIHARREAHRVEILHQGTQDWAEILGSIAHQPWRAADEDVKILSREVIDALPASMGVAELSATREIPHHSRVAAARVAYHQGWLSDTFATIYEDFERIEPGSDGGYLSIENDTISSLFSPRARFIEFLTTPESRMNATMTAINRLHTAVEERHVTLPARNVTRMGQYSDNVSIGEDDFFSAAASDAIFFAKDIFSPKGLQARAHYVETSLAWLPGAVARSVKGNNLQASESTGANAVRVDLSKRLRPGDLSLFGAGILANTDTVELALLKEEEPSPDARFDRDAWR